MGFYRLDRFAAFVVEDNRFIRDVMVDLLRHLGLHRILTAANGAEAIELLKAMYSDPKKAVVGFDFVISDLMMSPMNGLLLLRWMRTAKESPNRFIPFLMLSGAADHEYVKASRDLGVTEFLAKPFSVESVARRITEIIDYPRQFVATNSYFGPDRRRKNYGPPEMERRVQRQEDLTIVYSADKVVKPKSRSEVWYFRLPNALKEKAGGLGSVGPGELPLDLLEEAEKQLERAALDFTQWALDYLGRLSNLCTEAILQSGKRGKYFEEINLLAHELRGQGGTFGYPLITIFGKMLYEVTREGCREDDNAVEVVKAHIDAMRAVIREKITGDGGPIGRQLHRALVIAIKKYSPQ